MPCQLWTRCCACEPMESLQHNSVFIPRRARSTRWIPWKGNVLTHSRLEPSLAQGLEIARFPGMRQEVTCWVLVQFVEIAALLSRSGLVRAVTLQPEKSSGPRSLQPQGFGCFGILPLQRCIFIATKHHGKMPTFRGAAAVLQSCPAAQRALCCLLVFGIQHHL